MCAQLPYRYACRNPLVPRASRYNNARHVDARRGDACRTRGFRSKGMLYIHITCTEEAREVRFVNPSFWDGLKLGGKFWPCAMEKCG